MSDALSEVLSAVKLAGAVFFRGEFSAPFAVDLATPSKLVAHLFANDPSVRCIPFHIVERGEITLLTDGTDPIHLVDGDMIVVARDLNHVVSDGLGRAVYPGHKLMAKYGIAPNPVVHGGGGDVAWLTCGFLSVTSRGFEPLLDALPPVMTIRAGDEHINTAWLRTNLAYAVSEAASSRPGSAALTQRLTELMFVEVLRAHLASLSDGDQGWLAALNDAHMSRALNAFHAQPGRGWTVEELARKAGVSRSAFSARFAELMDMPPMQYVARWRCRMAADLMLDTELPIPEIAERVGYSSEAAFNRAFKRVMGAPPVTWANQQ
jgi:AraC-like DNA-binding protein